MDQGLVVLLPAALGLAVLHTLLGPDHYVPFIALSRARGWSRWRTLTVVSSCGVGHVAVSLALALVAVGSGWAMTDLVGLESARGELAGWLLLAFGVTYLVWGLKQSRRKRHHSHWHTHPDGTVHQHHHDHQGSHAHFHVARERAGCGLASWVLFLIFAFGPCEALIPLVVYPAAQGRWIHAAAVVTVFAMATLATMSLAVLAGLGGLRRVERRLPSALDRYGHAWAGAALVLCGVLVKFGL